MGEHICGTNTWMNKYVAQTHDPVWLYMNVATATYSSMGNMYVAQTHSPIWVNMYVAQTHSPIWVNMYAAQTHSPIWVNMYVAQTHSPICVCSTNTCPIWVICMWHKHIVQ